MFNFREYAECIIDERDNIEFDIALKCLESLIDSEIEANISHTTKRIDGKDVLDINVKSFNINITESPFDSSVNLKDHTVYINRRIYNRVMKHLSTFMAKKYDKLEYFITKGGIYDPKTYVAMGPFTSTLQISLLGSLYYDLTTKEEVHSV